MPGTITSSDWTPAPWSASYNKLALVERHQLVLAAVHDQEWRAVGRDVAIRVYARAAMSRFSWMGPPTNCDEASLASVYASSTCNTSVGPYHSRSFVSTTLSHDMLWVVIGSLLLAYFSARRLTP